jgi:hypothetical protein
MAELNPDAPAFVPNQAAVDTPTVYDNQESYYDAQSLDLYSEASGYSMSNGVSDYASNYRGYNRHGAPACSQAQSSFSQSQCASVRAA